MSNCYYIYNFETDMFLSYDGEKLVWGPPWNNLEMVTFKNVDLPHIKRYLEGDRDKQCERYGDYIDNGLVFEDVLFIQTFYNTDEWDFINALRIIDY